MEAVGVGCIEGAVGVGWRLVYWMGWMSVCGALTGLVLLSP